MRYRILTDSLEFSALSAGYELEIRDEKVVAYNPDNRERKCNLTVDDLNILLDKFPEWFFAIQEDALEHKDHTAIWGMTNEMVVEWAKYYHNVRSRDKETEDWDIFRMFCENQEEK